MSAVKLLVEHKQGLTSVRKLNYESKPDSSILIGSSKTARLRLSGQGLSPLHAMIERKGDDWYIADLGSSTGTWVSGESVVRRKISGLCTIQIGPHSLTLRLLKSGREIFVQETAKETAKEIKTAPIPRYHQVVVKRAGRVVETHLLDLNQSYTGFQSKTFKAPTTTAWTETKFGLHTIQQRLVAQQEIIESSSFEVHGMNIKKPLLLVVSGLILIGFAAALWPKAPESELALTGPSQVENVYQQMIFDSNLVKKKREEAKKIIAADTRPKQKAAGAAGGGNGMPVGNGEPGGGSPQGQKGAGGLATPLPGNGQGARLITNIRASGLNQLIGKIAKRSSRNVMQIGAGGMAVNPDTMASGNAMAAIAGTQTAPGSSIDKVAGVNLGAQNMGEGFRLGAVKTNGRGGGGTAYGSGVGLANGQVGTGTGSGTGYGNGVGSGMGLDDEAEVSGGLDKEVIADVIRRDIGQIRYCYERQLSSTPDLYGKVVVKFTINTEGAVELPKVGNTTLNNAMVEGCILRRAAKWKFPVPKGGTQVMVSYPFLFKNLK